MLQLQEAIKKIIERFIVGIIPFSSATAVGATVVPLVTSRRFIAGDQVAVYDQSILDVTGDGEVRTIACIDNLNSITLSEPLTAAYPSATSKVQKMVGGKFVQSLYLGSPKKIPLYPSITIDAKSKKNEWLTLESTTEEFNIDITIYTQEADYEESYRMMHIYAQQIERALFRSLYPLVEPFDCAILADPVVATDNVIRVTDANNLANGQLGWIWLESFDFLRYNRVDEIISPGVFQLKQTVGSPFAAGDKVIRPRRHFYDAWVRGIDYGTINTESAVLKAARIQYTAREERQMRRPFIDPLNF